MTPIEAAELLKHAAVFDNRKPSDAAALGWAAALRDVPLDGDALEAVARYYGTHDAQSSGQKWIQPHHVRSIRSTIRADRLRNAQLAPPPADPDDPERYRAALLGDLRALADGRNLRKAIGEGGPTEPSGDYKKMREAYEAKRAADKEAAEAAKLARIAAESSERAAKRRVNEAYAYLLAVPAEDAHAATALAREKLGPDADSDDVTILAAKLVDAEPVAPGGLSEHARETVARNGCPNGCSVLGHEKPCRYADDNSPIGRDPEHQS